MNGVSTNTFKTKLTHTDTTEAVYTRTNLHINVQLLNGNAFNTSGQQIPGIDTDKQILQNGKAKFFVVITNNGNTRLESLSTTDSMAPTCSKKVADFKTLLSSDHVKSSLQPQPPSTELKNNILDPGESVWYFCETQGIVFPEDMNHITVQAKTADVFGIPIQYETKALASYSQKASVQIEITSNQSDNPSHISDSSQVV